MHTPRARIQRAFLQWLEVRKHDFEARPITTRRTDTSIGIIFRGVTPQITAALTRWEINVAAWERGECWDLLRCLEAIPKRVTDGYACSLCLPEERTVYGSREALWRQHLFEPFLEWCNGAVANPHRLALYGLAGDATWAKLIDDSDVEHKLGAFSLIKVRR